MAKRSWETIKVPTGRFLTPLQVAYADGRIYLKFGYNKKLVEAMKDFSNRKWHGYDEPPEKVWSFPSNSRNLFRFEKLCGKKVFEQWDAPLQEFEIPTRHDAVPFWEHQVELFNHVLTRKQSIIAGDMGCGKSRVAIAAAEYINTQYDVPEEDMWFVGPVNAVNAVTRELKKWDCPLDIRMFTYDKLVSYLKEYEGSAPRVLIADEFSKTKNWATQRTKGVWHLAEAMREEHGNACWFFGMTGTPAPKSPVDWWSLAEISRPGFLKESTPAKLRNNLCLIEERENASGGLYPHIITWLDDEAKCATCGDLEHEHNDFADHSYTPSRNTLKDLYSRLKGLVIIKNIDECMDLPELVKRVIRVKPSMTTIRAAKIIRDSSHRAPQKLILLRELSDGFQYQDVEAGFKQCPRCLGLTKVMEYVPQDLDESGVHLEKEAEQEEIECPHCEGQGVVQNYEVKPMYVQTPKDAFLEYLLEEYAEYGRFVVWAAFTASIDRVVEICLKAGWIVLRVDGKGVTAVTAATDPDIDPDILMSCMDYGDKEHDALLRMYPKVLVVANAKSGGMAYTFTSAPADFYYSNDFDAESKIQSGARIRRGGMHTSRGVTSYEIAHLPEDMLVIDNLAAKRNMQAMTLNDITDYSVDYSNAEFFDGTKFI